MWATEIFVFRETLSQRGEKGGILIRFFLVEQVFHVKILWMYLCTAKSPAGQRSGAWRCVETALSFLSVWADSCNEIYCQNSWWTRRWYLLFNALLYQWVLISKDGIQMLKLQCLYLSLSPGVLFLVVISLVHLFEPECRWIPHSPIISQPCTLIISLFKVDTITHIFSIPFELQRYTMQ